MMFSGVAGGAASGKTTVCDMIMQQLHDQRAVAVNQVILLLDMLINISFFGSDKYSSQVVVSDIDAMH